MRTRLGVAVSVALICAGCGWAQFRGNVAHTGEQGSGSGIATGNVSTLSEAWTGVTTAGAIDSSPAVAAGVVYVGSADGKLYAFDAAGVSGCSGSPKVCAALWTATTAGRVRSSPAVAGGVVYVGSDDGRLYAFDAAGVSGCSGSPKVCAPLWSALTGGQIDSSPAVAGGVVYVSSTDGKLYAFDAAGVSGCSGIPKGCGPLWKADIAGVFGGSSPAVGGGVVYVGSTDGKLYAFDAAGVSGCSGSPKACGPLWTASTGTSVHSSPALTDGVVYVGSVSVGSIAGGMYAFDAAGVSGCSGMPKTCAPLWTGPPGNIWSSPAVTNKFVYIGAKDQKLHAFTL